MAQKRDLSQLVRPNIMRLEPYSCARSEFKGEARVFLDANENPFGAPFNRYPDPLQISVKEKIAKLKGVRPTQIMLGNGSDEPIDLIYRIFCRPGVDNVVSIEPSYGMYRVAADTNDVEFRTALLTEDFQLDAESLLGKTDQNTKVVWLCSPNNPTGNMLNETEIRKVIDGFDGIVVIDEAYIDFASCGSWLTELDNHPRLIVLQTFSKAWGLAGVRCGMAFANEEIIDIFNKVKYPYNINILTQQKVSEALDNAKRKDDEVATILSERKRLMSEFSQMGIVKHIYPTDANFILIKVADATATYEALLASGIVTRNRNKVSLCAGCLRITVGTPAENTELIEKLKTL